MITGKDVAKKCGVSVSTVSRVFSNSNLISNEVRELVIKTAKEMNYCPNINARNLKTNSNNTIGVIISDATNPFYLNVMNTMFSLQENVNKQLCLMFSEENSTKENNCVRSLISSKSQAIIFTPTDGSNKENQDLLIANKIPGLQMYRSTFDKLDTLLVDDEYGTYLATKELLDNGHTRILIFDPIISIPSHRLDGYIQAYKEKGLEPDMKFVIKFQLMGDVYDLIDKAFGALKPTAIIPVSAHVTHNLIQYLNEKNLKLKEDVSVIAYDEITMAKYFKLSVITHPFKEIAEAASEMLSNRIKDFNCKKQVKVIKPYLIKRDSVKSIK